jgi:hypothetical protein
VVAKEKENWNSLIEMETLNNHAKPTLEVGVIVSYACRMTMNKPLDIQ